MNNNLNDNQQPPVTSNILETKKNEEVIGEHDIIIDDDFQLKLEVSSVQGSTDVASSQQSEIQDETEIGTEQSGNITF